MAYTGYSDPYQGWSNRNSASNVTAHQIMTDTSGRWSLVYSFPGFRIYYGY